MGVWCPPNSRLCQHTYVHRICGNRGIVWRLPRTKPCTPCSLFILPTKQPPFCIMFISLFTSLKLVLFSCFGSKNFRNEFEMPLHFLLNSHIVTWRFSALSIPVTFSVFYPIVGEREGKVPGFSKK